MQQGFMEVRTGASSQMKRRMFNAGFSPMNVYDKLLKSALVS